MKTSFPKRSLEFPQQPSNLKAWVASDFQRLYPSPLLLGSLRVLSRPEAQSKGRPPKGLLCHRSAWCHGVERPFEGRGFLTWKMEIVDVSGVRVRLGRCHGEVAKGCCSLSVFRAWSSGRAEGRGLGGAEGSLSLGPSSSQAGLIRLFKWCHRTDISRCPLLMEKNQSQSCWQWTEDCPAGLLPQVLGSGAWRGPPVPRSWLVWK